MGWNDILRWGEEYRKLLGYLPRDFGFYSDFSACDYMMCIASIKGIRPVIAGKRMEELLEMVGLSKYKNCKMQALSSSMVRHGGFTQAMLNDPQILVLDEPTAGLGPIKRIRFCKLPLNWQKPVCCCFQVILHQTWNLLRNRSY